MITHYLDLEVETKGIRKDMRFYITNIGKEDLFLGYPWLAAYEPRFIWKDATIGEEALPVIIRSINPTIPHLRPTIARNTLEELKLRILHQLEEQSTLRTTSTDLAIQAEQYKMNVEIPPQYRKFAKVFSEEESRRFPPSRPWDHMIKFKKGAPEAIDCKGRLCPRMRGMPKTQSQHTSYKSAAQSHISETRGTPIRNYNPRFHHETPCISGI